MLQSTGSQGVEQDLVTELSCEIKKSLSKNIYCDLQMDISYQKPSFTYCHAGFYRKF